MAARAAGVGIRSDQVRSDYNRGAAGLAPSDSQGRSDLKAATRARTPAEVRAGIAAARPGLGPKPGSGGRANATNPAANRGAQRLGTAGRVAGVAGAGLAAHDIATSDNKPRAVVANAGSLAGGWAGGLAGAEAGAAAGPWGAVLGALIGAFGGGTLGYRAGEGAYDASRPQRPGSRGGGGSFGGGGASGSR